MRIIALIFVFLMSILHVTAQNVGTWKIYASYHNITEIEPTGSMVYALASGNIFSYRIKDGEVTTYDKTNGLSDYDIKHIAWSKSSKKLIVAYNNSNIDLLDNKGNITNIPDLYIKSMKESKDINNIYMDGIYAYLSLPFGIIKLNTLEENIVDTYQLGEAIAYCYIQDGYIYAASETKGILRANLNDNLLDKNNWILTESYSPRHEDKTNVYDATNKYWWTVNSDGKLTYYSIDANNERKYMSEGILPEGPASNNFYQMYLHNDKLYSVAGKWAQETDGNYPGEVHVWDGQNWTEFEQPTNETIGHRYVDLLCMDFDPNKEGHVMVGAKGGIYEFQDEKFMKSYDRSNSPLKSCINSNNYLLITGLKYDKEGNLWVANSTSNTDIDYPLWRYDENNNQWTSFSHTEMNGNYDGNLINFFQLSYDNRLWFLNNWWDVNKLYGYDTENDQLTDYGPNFVNEDQAILTPRHLYCAEEDKKGNIWLGTTIGPFYLSKSNVLNNTAEFVQHKVPRNDGTNYADYLLAGVEVRSMAVDEGNRKWMGTTDYGIYVISDDCNNQIHHFNTENSPLPSNTINDILIMPDGLVYIATDKGLCSYQSDISQNNTEMTKDNVYAYPNPVKPDYTGNIKIVGLTPNADVKIVSSNGSLVNQGTSTGNVYSWDGYDLKGKKVASGIYMVETATENGEKGTVCKIAIIR